MLSSQQLSWETFLKAMNEGDPEILMAALGTDRVPQKNGSGFWRNGIRKVEG